MLSEVVNWGYIYFYSHKTLVTFKSEKIQVFWKHFAGRFQPMYPRIGSSKLLYIILTFTCMMETYLLKHSMFGS